MPSRSCSPSRAPTPRWETDTDPGQEQIWDTRGSRTHRDPGHTQGSRTQAHLGSCFVVYCTRSRAGRAGPCGTGRFPARSRCSPVSAGPGPTDRDTPGLSPAHTGRGRSDIQVILPSRQPGRQQREHRRAGRAPAVPGAPGAAVEHQLRAETTSLKYNCPGATGCTSGHTTAMLSHALAPVAVGLAWEGAVLVHKSSSEASSWGSLSLLLNAGCRTGPRSQSESHFSPHLPLPKCREKAENTRGKKSL